MKKDILIIGAGPAGLTAAYELVKDKEKYNITILEATQDIGGISKTVKYNGNRIDIGGHRFFSKSSKVMQWWQNILPLQGKLAFDYEQTNTVVDVSSNTNAPDPNKEDDVFLVRNRLSRILFLRKFFSYPITLSFETIKNLGLFRMVKIGFSYIFAMLIPIKDEKSLEDFFINRFGKELYNTFFKDYTHKVWGVPCENISASWGAQRIKGLSITKTLLHAFKKLFNIQNNKDQKNVETSLIEKFFYPKFGPGQLWEKVLTICENQGVQINKLSTVTKIIIKDSKVVKVFANDKEYSANHIISTMPIKDLIASIDDQNLTIEVQKVAKNLVYRDFITVGLLLDKLKIQNQTNIRTLNNIIPDNWIYIQESDVKVGRLQIFNNWSPYMVKDNDKVWIGLEYFCTQGDDIWNLDENSMKKLAIDELEKIGIIDGLDVKDSVVIKIPKAYPAYFGSYDKFYKIKEYLEDIENLYCVGRNGMHRYNNMDHSMLSAIRAVENIQNNIKTKENIWSINSDEEYHESK